MPMQFDQPRFENFSGTLLVGMRTHLSLKENTTRDLWSRFMPARKEIRNVRGSDLYSVEVYDDTTFFRNFDPGKTFEKWAAVAVDTLTETLPVGMERLEIEAGLYVVFSYTGFPSEAHKMYAYIYGHWMPDSDYEPDSRPHFALMGSGYKGEHPESQEELWIPVRKKMS